MKTEFRVILPPRESVSGVALRAADHKRNGRIRFEPNVDGEQGMRPILFVVPGLGLRVHSYGVMIFCACAAALAMAVWRTRREKVDSNSVYELATWLFLGGVIGARLFFFIQHPEAFHRVTDIFRTWEGGNVFYGCIIGGLSGSILYWFRRPFPFLRMCDVAAPAVAIGAALGRIGCFLNGCCHGSVCDLPWAVRFPAGSHAWVRQFNEGLVRASDAMSMPVHPTQLYSAGAALVVLGMLLRHARQTDRCPGQIMALLMILYPMTRWPIEAIRSDEPSVFLGMSWSQNISVLLLAAGLATWRLVRRGQGARSTYFHRATPAPHLQSSGAPVVHSDSDANPTAAATAYLR
jgi:phosphatidylglycerol:prolipoprotein diacylglycerol transferase